MFLGIYIGLGLKVINLSLKHFKFEDDHFRKLVHGFWLNSK